MLDFYKGKKVFITGHTGFKGSWLTKILVLAGAEVTGYSLEPENEFDLFNICDIKSKIVSNIGDIRDMEALKLAFVECNPEIAFHLAAQPIVRESYVHPRYTYETNVMGTVNLLECVRESTTIRSVVNVTTDKVYENKEWEWGYRENDILNGFDPYSNSKSCSELVTSAYKNSFFNNQNVRVSSARSGNVIGGGDFAKHRIIPDCVRAAMNQTEIFVRNKESIRPYQHVLEPIFAYLLIGMMQYENKDYEGIFNIGPEDKDCISTGKLVEIFCRKWSNNQKWAVLNDNGPHETNFLKLDCSRFKRLYNWNPTWDIETALEKIIQWTMVYSDNGNISKIMDTQIMQFLEDFKAL